MEKLLSAHLISVAETFANSCNVSIVEFQLDEENKQVFFYLFVCLFVRLSNSLLVCLPLLSIGSCDFLLEG